MKVFVISKDNLLRLGKYIGMYLLGLSVGAISGLLPLMAVVAGLPIILSERQLGRRAAQLATLACLLATWLLLDELSFVYVGLGLIVGYSLAMVPPHVPIHLSFAQTAVTGFVWVAVMNFVVRMLRGEGLLRLFLGQLQQALALTLENMRELGAYTSAQVAEFEQYGELMLKALDNQWGYLLFVYLLISSLVTYMLSRALVKTEQPVEDLLSLKPSLPLAVISVALAGLHYLLPSFAPGLVVNLWSIASFLMSLAGFLLLFYYLRFFRLGMFWRILLGIYLFSSPIAWRVMLLVGLFDTVFDYRFYARKRQQEG
jgi:hypothetical protein